MLYPSWQQEDTQGLPTVATRAVIVIYSSYVAHRYASTAKKTPVGVNLLGELVIRVHLPIKCSQLEDHTPDKFVQRS
ncbi:MAG: hypothetical protein V7K22_09100, partial [Nostoc sp.]